MKCADYQLITIAKRFVYILAVSLSVSCVKGTEVTPDTNNDKQQENPENQVNPENPESPGTATFVITGNASEPENFSVTLHGTCTTGEVDNTWFLINDTEDGLDGLIAKGRKVEAKISKKGECSAFVNYLKPSTKYYYVIGGKCAEFSYFDINEAAAKGKTEHLIFNDGSGVQIKESAEPTITFGSQKDYFFDLVDGSTVNVVDKSAVSNLPKHEGTYRVYVLNTLGWKSLYLYLYGNVNDLGGAWPGIKSGGTLPIGSGETYGEVKSFTSNSTAGNGTSDNPYTVADASVIAHNLAVGTNTDQYYYVKGTIYSIKDSFTEKYGNATFNLTEEKDYPFLAYRVNYLENRLWTENDPQIEVGDEVVICCKLYNYEGISETHSGYLSSHIIPAGSAETGEPEAVYWLSARLSGTFTAPSSGSYGAGFLVSKDPDPTFENSWVWHYGSSLSGLMYGTKYYYRAYVRTRGGDSLGEIKSFTTKSLRGDGSVNNPLTVRDAHVIDTVLDYPGYYGSIMTRPFNPENPFEMTITVMPEGGRVKHTAQFFYIKGVVKELPNRWSDIEYNIVDADGPDDVYFNIVDCRYFCGRSRESEETCPYKGADVTFKCQIKNHIDYKHTSYAAMLWSLNGARDCAIPVDMGVSVKWAKTFLGGGDYISGTRSKPDYDPPVFRWGETEPFSETSAPYAVDSYNAGGASLDLANDAAHVWLGGKWRMPTGEEVQELLNNCNIKVSVKEPNSAIWVVTLESKTTGNRISFRLWPGDTMPPSYYYINLFWSSSLSASTDYPLSSFYRLNYYPDEVNKFSSRMVLIDNASRQTALHVWPVMEE